MSMDKAAEFESEQKSTRANIRDLVKEVQVAKYIGKLEQEVNALRQRVYEADCRVALLMKRTGMLEKSNRRLKKELKNKS